jgi:4-hydroxybenzoate synthetase (chorismate lyase)
MAAALALAAVAGGGCVSTDTRLLGQFEDTLRAHDSATAALRQWCEVRRIAEAADIVARRVPGADAPPPPGARESLGLGADEPLGYRHVRLTCGETVLSEAHNWFVPSRLPEEMNARLASTDLPFGKVIAPLNFRRERLGEEQGAGPGCPAGTVLSQHALLRLPDGRPIALLTECYAAAILR